MKISVIIPTYNRKHTLNRAIHSVLSQTSQPREIIAVDDGSTDGTKEWLAKMYPAIRYIHQSNSGVSAARNVGIKTAQGDWLAFLDSDDEWLPQKLERQVAAVAEAMLQLASSPETCEQMGRAGASLVRDHYTWPAIAARLDTALGLE